MSCERGSKNQGVHARHVALRSRLKTSVSNFDLIQIIKINMRERISKIVYSIHITNLKQLCRECHDAERMLATRDSRQSRKREHQKGFSYRPRMEELGQDQQEYDWTEKVLVEARY